MARLTTALTITVVAMSLASTPATADDFTTGFANGSSGLVAGLSWNDDLNRLVEGRCAYATDTAAGDDVQLSVVGGATSGGDTPAGTTSIQCIIKDGYGATVFDLTRSETGPAATMAVTVVIGGDGPYTVCARSRTLFGDGARIFWPDHTTLACASP